LEWDISRFHSRTTAVLRWNGIKKTERKNVKNANIYILKHLDVNHFIDMSMKKICEYIYVNNIQGGKSGSW
jgi:hypothetical protein